MSYTNPTNDGTAFIVADSISITSGLNKPAVCTFETSDLTGNFRFSQGEQVVILDDATSARIFAGIVYETVERVTPGSGALRCRVRATDFGQILDRRRVTKIYDNQTLHAIIADLISTYLTSDGITGNNVTTGPTFTRVVFDYKTVTEALNELATFTGYHWYVDYDKDIFFGPRTNSPAGFSVTDATQTWHDLSVTRTLQEYRNTQILRAGDGLTDEQVETIERVGTQTTFTVAFPIGTEPTVTQNGASRTVGILGLETGFDFYWNKGRNTITADASLNLSANDFLVITYRGLIPVIVRGTNDAEIAARAGVQADSGVFEDYVRDGAIDSVDLALDKTTGLLRRHGSISRRVEFSMDSATNPSVTGLRVGQVIPVSLDRHGIDEDYLVEGITIKDVGLEFYRYTVTLASGEVYGGWTEFFRKLAEQHGGFAIREDEVLVTLKQYRDTVTLTDSLTITEGTP